MSETEDWLSLVHVRDHALDKAILMVRANHITVDDHLKWAKRYWDFLYDGTTPMPSVMEVPDDISALEPPGEYITEADLDPLPPGEIPPWQSSDFPDTDYR